MQFEAPFRKARIARFIAPLIALGWIASQVQAFASIPSSSSMRCSTELKSQYGKHNSDLCRHYWVPFACYQELIETCTYPHSIQAQVTTQVRFTGECVSQYSQCNTPSFNPSSSTLPITVEKREQKVEIQLSPNQKSASDLNTAGLTCETKVLARSGTLDFQLCTRAEARWACYEDHTETCRTKESPSPQVTTHRVNTGRCVSQLSECW